MPNLMFPDACRGKHTRREVTPVQGSSGCRGVAGLVPQPLFMKLIPVEGQTSPITGLIASVCIMRGAAKQGTLTGPGASLKNVVQVSSRCQRAVFFFAALRLACTAGWVFATYCFPCLSAASFFFSVERFCDGLSSSQAFSGR